MHDFNIVQLFSFFLIVLAHIAHANVEKTIFIAPPPNPVPLESPAFDDLGLERLSSLSPVIRTFLNASFPTQDAPQGAESWFLLQDLNSAQRYERLRSLSLSTGIWYLVYSSNASLIRIWNMAVQAPNANDNHANRLKHQQPTTFSLNTFTLSETISDSVLMSTLGAFSSAHQASYVSINQVQTVNKRSHRSSAITATESVLFLRIFAAADYFTLNTEMMENVPPVIVDVILDPYLFNVLPLSLVPTLGWVAVAGAVGCVAGGWIAKSFRAIMDEAENIDYRNRADKIKKRKKI
ncbi:hypothetical protein Egran_06205 [Elaphomyces granulatus]|uniref:Uncharacterized protein n=1 Tax=Elaphomyces granulatus TaxID=519963 RepID=A0A232LPG5_9EURO|nr:hypothetical protein Egran_06205 [Elaphomyces granulatus]